MTYLEHLSRELSAVGIRGRLRARIEAEIRDHLSCDPGAELGPPAELARQFADELGTVGARRAANASFAALSVAGIVFAGAFLSAPAAGLSWRTAQPHSSLLGDAAGVIAILAAQVAFVAGSLALVRALRRRHVPVLSRPEATVIVRRAAVGAGAGLAVVASLAVIAVEFDRGVAGWWVASVLAAAGAAGAGLVAAAPAVWSAARIRPTGEGTAGDLSDDLGQLMPGRLRGQPWRLALTVAAAVALLCAAAGALASDGIDGMLRGLADGAACLAGFALLGRYLGLRDR